jgi:hypothetical protein
MDAVRVVYVPSAAGRCSGYVTAGYLHVSATT